MSEDPQSGPDSGPSTATEGQRWKKKIIVCCDGTGKSESGPISNVFRIFNCIAEKDEKGVQQEKFYGRGIGTEGKIASALLEKAVGAGIDKRIQNAYRFICEKYESSSLICLVGYSRGAFTVRCLAKFIEAAGLLKEDGLSHLPRVFSLWKKGNLNIKQGHEVEHETRLNIRVQVCAVWDTVSSLGLPMMVPFPQPAPTRMIFVNSRLGTNIDEAFQAIALHEHRRHFLPIIWRYDNTSSRQGHLEQCWFAGYHCDIGGGRKEECLAHIALIWMMARLAKHLKFNIHELWNIHPQYSSWRASTKVGNHAADSRMPDRVRDSLTGFFRLGGSRNRKPRCHFWDPEFSEISPQSLAQDQNSSRERMHLTLRALVGEGGIKSVEVLNGTVLPNIEDHPGPYTWSLQQHRNDAQRYQVPEESMESQEIEWLDEWIRMDIRILQQISQPGDKPPKTKIPWLLQSFFVKRNRNNGVGGCQAPQALLPQTAGQMPSSNQRPQLHQGQLG